MNILLLAATVMEIRPFIQQYNRDRHAADIDIIITGVGLTATVYAIMQQLRIKRPGIMIQAGIAGSFTTDITPGSTVIVKKDRVADEGVVENGKLITLFDLQLAEKDRLPFINGWLVNNSFSRKQVKLPKVNAISVSDISNAEQKIAIYRKAFRPQIETMEGAAFHYTAIMEKIPFLQLRAISNYVGVREKKEWKMKKAIANLNQSLAEIVESL
jgi:futalosine hydrolase